MTAPEINPETGRPYRMSTWRRILAGRRHDASEARLEAQIAGAEARKDERRSLRTLLRAQAEADRSVGTARVPEHLRGLEIRPLAVAPDEARKTRDRSLRGKDRIRARRAARRSGGAR